MFCKFHNKKKINTQKLSRRVGLSTYRSGSYKEQNLEGTPQGYLYYMHNEIIGKVIFLWYLSVFSDFSKLHVLKTLVIVEICIYIY